MVARRSGAAIALLIAACFSVAALSPATARGADKGDVRKAREHFRVGEQAFKEGRYQDAYREWQAGYELSPRALFLLNMAHAERRRGDLPNARVLYRRYLLMEPDSKLRGEVEQVLKEIDAVLPAQDGPGTGADQRPPAVAPGSESAIEPPPAVAGPPPSRPCPRWSMLRHPLRRNRRS